MEKNTVCIDVGTYKQLMFVHKAMTDKRKLVLIRNAYYTNEYNDLTHGDTAYIYTDDAIAKDLKGTIDKRDQEISRLDNQVAALQDEVRRIKAMSVKQFKQLKKENK